VAAIVERI
jgi:hypothetical protein